MSVSYTHLDVYKRQQLVDGKCPDCGGDVHDAKERLTKEGDAYRLIERVDPVSYTHLSIQNIKDTILMLNQQ